MEGNSISLYCNKSGKPDPVITWTRLGGSEVVSNTSLLTVANVRRPGNPDNLIQYQCTASNGVENPAIAVANVTVHCKSDICLYGQVLNFFSILCLKNVWHRG